ncbi:unnamed protein product [Pylaiella littoralis]
MTPTVCAIYCRRESASYTYHATQYGEECWCQDADIDLRHGEGTCDFRCSGDESVVCGGVNSFNLYGLESVDPPSPPTDENYVGCFADDRDDRVLGTRMSSSTMTSEACATYCAKSAPNTFYATQYGQECWCAADVDLRHGEGECDYACTGDTGITCGGFDSFDLFRLDPAVTNVPTSTPTDAPTPENPSATAAPTSPGELESPLTWQYEGTEFEIRATAEWDAVASFEVPDSGGDVAEFLFSSSEGGRLEKIRVGSEIYRVDYASSGNVTEFVLEDSDGRRALQSDRQKDPQLPIWLDRSFLAGATISRKSTCQSCQRTLFYSCAGAGLACIGASLVTGPLAPIVGAFCGASTLVCTVSSAAEFEDVSDTCKDLFCCDRSKCGRIVYECYDEATQRCCDETVTSGCCEGEQRCGSDSAGQATCFVEGEQSCCDDGSLVGVTGCCPNEVGCLDGLCYPREECCPQDTPCGGECINPENASCCEDGSFVNIGDACPDSTPPAPAPQPGSRTTDCAALLEEWEQNCLATPAPQPSEEDEPKRGGSADGDPHLRVFDGTGFDCHGQGEFVLTRAAATESEVQARFQQWSQNPNPAVTVTTAIAARETGSSLIQVTTAASGGVEVFVDGELFDEGTAGTAVTGVALDVTPSRVEMRFPSGLDVFVFTTIIGILRARVYAPVSLATTGLLGNNNGELGDDFTTVDGETVAFAATTPTVEEGTNYCTTNWCTTAGESLFTYVEGENHGTFDLCDAVYSGPLLPDVIPAAITELCGDNADCILDALLAGEEVGRATLEGQAQDRVFQEEVGGLCASNSFSSTGAPPCTACFDGEVSGTGATSCIREELVGLGLPENIATAIAADATGGFAGPGSLTITDPAGAVELTEADAGSISLSGTFVRDDGAALPGSTSVFIYCENAAQPDDFVRGQEALDPSTGAFSTVVTDIPAGSSRLFLSFVVVDPAEALDPPGGADTAFALDVSNSACVPSLTITLEWAGDTSDVDLFVTEPDGMVVSYINPFGTVGFLDNDDRSGFGPENYIIDSGLDPATDQVLGEYQAYVDLYRGDQATETWRLTSRVAGEVSWTEEGNFTSSTTSDTFTVSLADYNASCGGAP